MFNVNASDNRARTTAQRFGVSAWRFASTLAAALIVAASPDWCLAVPVLAFDENTGDIATNQNQSVGWQFDVLSPITVTGLGWFDDVLIGLRHSHTVGIWSPDGTLLQSVLVPDGIDAPLDGQFRTVAVTPFVLNPGTGYVVGGENFDTTGDPLAANVTQTVDPRIHYVDATFSLIGTGFVRPTLFSAADTGFYGPSFSTPEPSSITLAAMALGALVGFVRRWTRRTLVTRHDAAS